MINDDYINGYKDGVKAGADIKNNFNFEVFGMNGDEVLNILGEYVKNKQSQTPDIPIGFKFSWNERHIYNNVFKQLSEQGFKVTK